MNDNRKPICAICGECFQDGITYWKHLNGFAHPECVRQLKKSGT